MIFSSCHNIITGFFKKQRCFLKMTAVFAAIFKNSALSFLLSRLRSFALLAAVDLNGFVYELAGAWTTACVDVLGEFAAGGVGLAEIKKDLIGTGVHVLGDEGLYLVHDVLRFL